jgi:hypothetical protein
MATHRGFVRTIEVGRAGLVTVNLILADGSAGTYIIRDLDGDPERFNERLSKLGILRDAMNRAEPVEIEHTPTDGGEEIQRAVRISRDALAPLTKVDQLAGLIVSLQVYSENGVDASGEKHDIARVGVLTNNLNVQNVVLDLQAPERQVANAQLDLLWDAQARGLGVTLGVEPQPNAGPSLIISVQTGDPADTFGDDGAKDVSGFVESLSLIRISGGGNFAQVGFTTAPDFTGSGNVVSSAPFTPALLSFLVSKNSEAYELFEAGLRDNLRMRVHYVHANPKQGNPNDPGKNVPGRPSAVAGGGDGGVDLALSVELLAPIASASRPVWVSISRESLDKGPEAACADGVPSSDLTAKTLRDLHIPYAAVWKGYGCFNHGVYRFQIGVSCSFNISLDGEPLCVHASDDPAVKFAYACLCGEHEVCVELDGWTCDQDFVFDVYRLR